MLRKRLSRWTSRTEGGTQPQAEFPDAFWTAYLDFLTRRGPLHSDVLPVNSKKYSSTSSAVGHVRSLFSPELPQPSVTQVIAMLKSPFSGGDVARAYFLIRVFQLSTQGLFITNDAVDLCGNEIRLMGAENWENVMCYMDALLFSMFAKLDSFEPMLFLLNQNPNPLVGRLTGLLRVYVNLMRLGNLITTDLSQAICECLATLGFTEATSHRQQDCAPLFEFLTETLAMPLLTFRVEIQHSGKYDDDDRRYSKERILFVSVPEPNPDAETNNIHDNDEISLEECLEHYFNNSISVKRELQRRATLDSLQPNPFKDTFTHNALISAAITVDAGGSQMKPFDSSSTVRLEEKLEMPMRASSSQIRVRTRSSTLSVWSINSFENKNKEVMLPAWMLLRLLPFYTDDNDTRGGGETFARSSQEFANRRPVLPICLKRYSFAKGDTKGSRSQRRITIPPVINLPLFVAEDDNMSDNLASGFKLVLESAVCHRGHSIESGHFVSAVRVETSLEDQTLEESLAASWYLYDDMKKTRVVTKTFKELFDSEWPYILFYRLVASNDGRERMVSIALSGHPSHISSPIVAPKGAKANFWAEESEPISALNILDAKDVKDSKDLKSSGPGPSIIVDTINNPSQSPVVLTPVEPVTNMLPNNPRYVDIRKRYLWYVTDRKKNYYKELACASKTGSNISISVTPQFRRNSQWSNSSNISGLVLESRQCLDKEHSEVNFELDATKIGPKRADSKKVDKKVGSKKVDGAFMVENLVHQSEHNLEAHAKERKHHLHHIFSHERDEITSHLAKNSEKCGKCAIM